MKILRQISKSIFLNGFMAYELGLSEKTLHYLRSRNVISLNDLEKQREQLINLSFEDRYKLITK